MPGRSPRGTASASLLILTSNPAAYGRDALFRDELEVLTMSDITDALVEAVRRYVRERLVRLDAEVAANDRIPPAIIEEMKPLGLCGLRLPEAFGGPGLTAAEEVRVAQALGYTSPAFRSAIGTNIGIGAQGSVIDGTKRYTANARRAGVFTLMARTGTVEEGARGVATFPVDANLPGISLGKPDKNMGQKGAHTRDVVFNGVRVHRDQLIGGRPGQGFKTAVKVLDRGRLHLAAAATGCARRLID